ncbi:hypothetical protein MKX01_002351 [Papaver californicum]|nr:hypothetical protein MKX01_002351 [Papaver californicum]
MEVYNVQVKLIDGKTTTLKFTTPTKSGTKQINNETLIVIPNNNKDGTFITIQLVDHFFLVKEGLGHSYVVQQQKQDRKKTNNFDACRDMSGGRLRHVNTEKKLEEWKAEEEERKLEKDAEEFLNKKGKDLKKTVRKGDEKYREDSDNCMAVKEFDDESKSSDDEDDGKSEVLDDGSHDVKLKDGEGSSGSGSGSMEKFGSESSSPVGLLERSSGCFEVGQGLGVHIKINQLLGPESESREDIVSRAEVRIKRNGSVETKSESDIQIVDESATVSNLETGSSFVSNATLQERASRLFLLKTTPVSKLPKKLLAKK